MKFFSPKLFSALKGYSASKLVSDLVAGIIVAIIALPLSIALALASGVGPEQGIYTAIVAGFVIALFGGSHVQISGPTAAFATIVAGIVAENIMVWCFSGNCFAICMMSSAKPISSIRSASSKIKKDTLDKSTYPKLKWLINLPGVAITTSAPNVRPLFSCSKRIPSLPPYTATLDAGIK